jgi:sec-independent protein translocase protein TatC
LIPTQKKSIFSKFSKSTNGAEQKEMTFMDHLEALRWHLVRSLIAWIVLSIAIFIFRDWIFDHIILAPRSANFISYTALCNFSHYIHIGDALCMPPVNIPLQFTTVNGPFVAALNISMIGGFIAAFPYIFYEIWKFIKPALSSKELKYGGKSIFWVSFCLFLGAAFGYYVLAPFTFNFLANFKLGTQNAIEFKPTLDDYISTLTNLLLGCGLAFELPIIAVVLAKVGLITAKFLKIYRRYAYVLILVLAAILTPSPDWISQAIVAMPLVVLFEVSIILVKKIDKKKAIVEKQWE